MNRLAYRGAGRSHERSLSMRGLAPR
ncbi:hypothetical protein EMIT047CA2_20034 [Pseudomonas soli]